MAGGYFGTQTRSYSACHINSDDPRLMCAQSCIKHLQFCEWIWSLMSLLTIITGSLNSGGIFKKCHFLELGNSFFRFSNLKFQQNTKSWLRFSFWNVLSLCSQFQFHIRWLKLAHPVECNQLLAKSHIGKSQTAVQGILL